MGRSTRSTSWLSNKRKRYAGRLRKHHGEWFTFQNITLAMAKQHFIDRIREGIFNRGYLYDRKTRLYVMEFNEVE